MTLHGRNLIIKNGANVAIAAAKSCEIDVKTDHDEVSSPTTGQWKEFIEGRSGWEVSISALVAPDNDYAGEIAGALLKRGILYTLDVVVTDNNDSDVALTGHAYCQNAHLTGTVGSLIKGSWKFLGSGPLEPPTPSNS